MHRFYIDLTKTGNLITNSESYHAIRVLRVKVGEKIVCFDGNGNESICLVKVVDESNKKHPSLLIDVLSSQKFEKSKFEKVLIVSSFKLDRLEWGIEKAVELGIDRIIVSQTKYSQVPLSLVEKKMDRLNEIVLSASKQCERKYIPTLELKEFKDILSLKGNRYVANRDGKGTIEKNVSDTYIFVGPEGGFEENELKELISSGFVEVSLASNILRAETAMAIASFSI